MTKKTFVLILLASIFLTSCSTDNTVTFSEERNSKWIEDISYLQENLSKVHAKLYKNISEEEFNKRMDQIKEDIPNLEDIEIQLRLKEIFPLVGDAHLMLVDFESSIQKVFSLKTLYNIFLESELDEIYPIKTQWFEDGLYTIEIDSEHKKALGTKLVKINNYSIEDVMEKVNSLISHNNEWRLKFLNPMYIIHPNVLEFFDFANEDKAIFTFETAKGEQFDLEIKTIKTNQVKFISVLDSVESKPLYMKKDDFFWYEYLPQDKIMYFKFNVCVDTHSFDYNKMGNLYHKSTLGPASYTINNEPIVELPDFQIFANELFKEIDENQVDKLVIDLRDNNGGALSMGEMLIQYITSREEINKKGKLFIITNRGSFSAPIKYCSNFKEKTEALIFGEPTGEMPFTGGGAAYLQLPNSKLHVFFSKKLFWPIDEKVDTFIPDTIVNITFEEYKRGFDTVLEAIKNH